MNDHQSNKPTQKGGTHPFWQPWSYGGYVGKTIVLLLGIVALSALFAYLSGSLSPKDIRDLPPDQRDDYLVRDWNDSIIDVPELPNPDDNFIPPVDRSKVIPNPEDSTSMIESNRLIILFDSEDLKSDMAKFAKQFKGVYPDPSYSILYYNPICGTMFVEVPEEFLMAVAHALPEKITGIDFMVATNEMLNQGEVRNVPSDPDFQESKYDEYFRLIQAYDAWDVTKGSSDVVVAIVDGYFDLDNPELNERYINPIHIPTKTNLVRPPKRKPQSRAELSIYCHGSHVAGIAIGSQNNDIGCSGIAPECSWIPISLGDELTTLTVLEGTLYAVYHGADVVNISLGKKYPEGISDLPEEEQIEMATKQSKLGEKLWDYVTKIANDHNTIICTSAGNNSILMALDSKKRSSHIVKVEAVDGQGHKADFSNYGKIPDSHLDYSTISAPGVGIWSATNVRTVNMVKADGIKASKEGLQEMSGTSMASPMVAGAIALFKSKNKKLTADEVISILKYTAKKTDSDKIGGVIQIKDGLDMIGEEGIKFNDLMQNHQRLIGTWKSTNNLVLTNGFGVEIDEVWLYFTFDSEESGSANHTAIETKRHYISSVNVEWENDRIVVIQNDDLIAEDGDEIRKDDYILTLGENGQLEGIAVCNGEEKFNFTLERVK